MSQEPDSPGVIALPPLLYGLALAIGALLRWIARRPMVTEPTGYWIGGALLVAGAALAFWGRGVMDRAGTNVDPRKPTTAIVEAGPFRFTRNPLYVAMTILYLGLAFCLNDIWFLPVLVVLLVVMHYGVVLREERYLETKFGQPYRDYTQRVRRWL
jgi:protein-S-isoprenylcysteine O-methyltransferase Ste14